MHALSASLGVLHSICMYLRLSLQDSSRTTALTHVTESPRGNGSPRYLRRSSVIAPSLDQGQRARRGMALGIFSPCRPMVWRKLVTKYTGASHLSGLVGNFRTALRTKDPSRNRHFSINFHWLYCRFSSIGLVAGTPEQNCRGRHLRGPAPRGFFSYHLRPILVSTSRYWSSTERGAEVLLLDSKARSAAALGNP